MFDAPALKTNDADGLTQGMKGEAVGAGLGAAAGAQQGPGEVAADGMGGAGQEIPHRAAMEKSFGMDFGDVRAHFGPAAKQAAGKLGAHAYATGNNIAFANADPDPALVAHELTHVVQARGGSKGAAGPQLKSADTAVDKSGEPEAEKVEGAVKAGRTANSALEGGVATGGSPALKAGKGIARSESGAPFTFGMSFSPQGMEKTYEYNLWENPGFEVPIPAVPGLNFKLKPMVKVVAGAGINWHEKALEAKLNVLGDVQAGFSYGHSELAEVYAVLESKAEGGFNYKKLDGGGREAPHPAPKQEGAAPHDAHAGQAAAAPKQAGGEAHGESAAKSWEFTGAIALSTNFRVGIEMAGGWVDWGFDFGQCEIGKLTGLAWKDGHFDKSAVGWEWGAKPKEFFGIMRKAVDKAKQLKSLGEQAFKSGMETAKKAGKQFFNTASNALNWVSSW
jgi:hypothetical protein